MSSRIAEAFPPLKIEGRSRAWPNPGRTTIGDSTISIVFKGDPGYLRIASAGGYGYSELTPYGTKSTLRRNPTSMKFEINQTIEEFMEKGIDPSLVSVEHDLEGEALNHAVHLLRLFSSWANSSGNYNGRRSIIS